MSYQEKRTVTSMLSGFIMIAAYAINVLGRVRSGALSMTDLTAWAMTMLIFIGIGIAITIIIQILFHIGLSVSTAVSEKIQNRDCDEKEIDKRIKVEMLEDERDQLVSLKASQIGFGVAGGGFVLALLTLVFNVAPAVMLNIAFISFWAGTLVEGAAQIYFYRRGI